MWHNNNMISFRDSSHRLSGEDIRKILKNCKLCYKMISNGKNIYSPSDILSILLPRTKKIAIILNTHDHWLCLLIFNNRACLIVDSLNEVQNWPDVMKNIAIFCKINGLKRFLYNSRFQTNYSQICGSLTCFVIFKFSVLSFLGFLKMRKTFSSNCISSNERAIMRSVRIHFNLN